MKGTGLNVWDGAVLLSYYLESKHQVVDQKRIIELGAGCGLTGIAAAILGAKEVILTDLQYTLSLVQANIDLNKWAFPVCCDRIECKECDWMCTNRDTLSNLGFSDNKPPDLILAADCVWLEELVEPFLQTLVILSYNNKRCKILISYQRRGKEVHAKFTEGLKRLFQVEEVSYNYKWSSAIQIFECTQR